MFRFKNAGGLHLTKLLMQNPKCYNITHLNHLKFMSTRPRSLLLPGQSFRCFSSQQQEANQEPLDELELEALAIQKGIDEAK